MGVNPFSVFTGLKAKGAVKTVYAAIESFEVFIPSRFESSIAHND